MSIVQNPLLNISDLHVTGEVPAFSEDVSMHFMNIQKNGRSLTLRVKGVTDSDLIVHDFDGNTSTSFFFKPNENEIDNLVAIEDLIPKDVPEKYEHKNTLNADFQLNIKLKTDKKDDQKFAFVAPFNPSNVVTELVKGKECVLDLVPGFYFSDDGDRHMCGLFYRLKAFKFINEPKVEVKSKTKGKKST